MAKVKDADTKESRGAEGAEPEGAFGHGPGCYGECDGLYDCSAPAPIAWGGPKSEYDEPAHFPYEE